MKMLSVNDLSFYRKDMTIHFDQNDAQSQQVESNYKFKINLPFPDCDRNENHKSKKD